MTDLEKTKKLFDEFGISYEEKENDVGIFISLRNDNKKTFLSYMECDFNFEKDGNFRIIDGYT